MQQPYLSRGYGKPALIQRARELRRNPTQCERLVWKVLRELRHSHAVHFRRQAPIGPYIADFCCHRLKVIIEADGESHILDDDKRRDAWFARTGYRTIRIENKFIRENAEWDRHLLQRLGLEGGAPVTGGPA